MQSKQGIFSRVKKLLQLTLSGVNVVTTINTWAVSLLRYSAAFLCRTTEKLRGFDRRTRQNLTIFSVLHPRDSP